MGKQIDISEIREISSKAREKLFKKEFEDISEMINRSIKEAASNAQTSDSVYIHTDILPITIDKIMEEYEEFHPSHKITDSLMEIGHTFYFEW